MADKQEEPVVFSDNPKDYCKQVYAEAARRQDDLRTVNADNRMFYEGQDDDLERRASDPDVARSSLFIHELKPAIDTRISDVISLLEEREFPISIRPDHPNPTSEMMERAGLIERVINGQLRDCGYLADGFRDHVTAAEIYRSPSAVKVGWENVYDKEAVLRDPTEQETIDAVLSGGRPPAPRVIFEEKYKGGRPYVELLPPDQFLYEPGITKFDDSEYVIHVTWVTWGRLMAMAADRDWDVGKLKSLREDMAGEDKTPGDNKTFSEELQDRRDIPEREGYRDGKFLVAEFLIRDYNEMGEEKYHQVTMVGNRLIVENTATPYAGIKYPYVLLVANPLPGTIEGMSSIDVCKNMQRVLNEAYNSFLDGITYRIFPPLIQEPGTEFTERPQWKPGAIWKVSNSEGLRPLIENPGIMPDLPALVAALAGKIREVLNAHDISQGFQSQEYEKATATQLRAHGANKRSMPTRKRYGEALVKVARMILALNQQYHPEAPLFAMPVIIDVPSLTNMSDPDSDKQESLLLMTQALQNPLYQTPTGMLKIRNLMEDVVEKFKKTQTAKFVPTEEELLSDMEAQRNVAMAQMQKQAVVEQMELQQQSAPQ